MSIVSFECEFRYNWLLPTMNHIPISRAQSVKTKYSNNTPKIFGRFLVVVINLPVLFGNKIGYRFDVSGFLVYK